MAERKNLPESSIREADLPLSLRRQGSNLHSSRRVNRTGMAVAGAVAAVISGGNAVAETLEQKLGNANNYEPVPFVNNDANQIVRCRVMGNTLRWWQRDKADASHRTVVERDFEPILPAGITALGEERLVHGIDPTVGYNDSFVTESGNSFEDVAAPNGNGGYRYTLSRNLDTIITTDLDSPAYFDYGPVAPLWNNQIGVIIGGANRGGTYDSGDLCGLDEMVPGPMTTHNQVVASGVHRTDLDPDPVNANQANVVTNFALTGNHAFVASWVNPGGNGHVDIFDRGPNDQAINKRFLSSNAGLGCAFEDANALVVFGWREGALAAATYLKNDGETLQGNADDGIENIRDNCINTSNPTQTNSDLDDKGDACDNCPNEPLTATETEDPDNDGVCTRAGNSNLSPATQGNDNCPNIANPDQADSDHDGQGNACDPFPNDAQNDGDGDGISGNLDNCPAVFNPDQANDDGDTFGTACDDFPLDQNNDIDGDFLGANEDNCPEIYNITQADNDGDGMGNECDPAPNCATHSLTVCPHEDPDAGSAQTDAGGNSADGGTANDAGNITVVADGGTDAGEVVGVDAGEEDAGALPGTDGNGVFVADAGEDGGQDGPKERDAGHEETSTDANDDTHHEQTPEDPAQSCMGCSQSNGNHAADCFVPLAMTAVAFGAMRNSNRKRREEKQKVE